MRNKKVRKRILALLALGSLSATALAGCKLFKSNEPECIYGPPEMFNNSSDDDPANNVGEDIYGPPEMFGEDPDDGASDNEPECIYGPPEMFDDGD